MYDYVRSQSKKLKSKRKENSAKEKKKEYPYSLYESRKSKLKLTSCFILQLVSREFSLEFSGRHKCWSLRVESQNRENHMKTEVRKSRRELQAQRPCNGTGWAKEDQGSKRRRNWRDREDVSWSSHSHLEFTRSCSGSSSVRRTHHQSIPPRPSFLFSSNLIIQLLNP